MRKIILGIIGVMFGILLVGLAYSGGLLQGIAYPGNVDASTKLDKTVKDTFTAKGINDINISEMICNDDECKFTLYKKDIINREIKMQTYWMETYESGTNEDGKPIYSERRIDYTEAEILSNKETRIKDELTYLSQFINSQDTPINDGKYKFSEKGVITIKK